MKVLLYMMLLATSSSASAQQVLSLAELKALTDRARSFVPRDQFDVPPAQPSVAGKRFSYEVAPLERRVDYRLCSGFPAWGYNADRTLDASAFEKLTLGSSLTSYGHVLFQNTDDSAKPFISIDSFTCSIEVGETAAVDAHGVQYNVRTVRETIDGIAESVPYMREWAEGYVSAPIVGEEARDLARNLRVRVGGSLSDWSPGVSVKCGTERRQATVDQPSDRTTNVCMIKGKVDKIEILNAATGRSLAKYSAGRRDF